MNQFLFLMSLPFFFGFAQARSVEPITEFPIPSGTFNKQVQVKVAAIAVNPTGDAPVPATAEQAEAFKASNRAKLEARIREAAAQGAEIIITPEFGVTGYPNIPGVKSEEQNYRSREDIAPYIEAVPGPSSEFFGHLAAELKIYIQFSLATGDTPTSPFHDSAVVVDPRGQVVAYYNKMELFHIEENFIIPGTEPSIYEGPAGQTGIIICSDSYSPKALGFYRGKVDLLTLSTSWAESNTGMDQFQQTAQSVGSFLIAANQMYFPDSGVVNRDGSLQSHVRQSEVTAYGYLPRKKRLGIFP
jgi:predicted amidohydrolase